MLSLTGKTEVLHVQSRAAFHTPGWMSRRACVIHEHLNIWRRHVADDEPLDEMEREYRGILIQAVDLQGRFTAVSRYYLTPQDLLPHLAALSEQALPIRKEALLQWIGQAEVFLQVVEEAIKAAP